MDEGKELSGQAEKSRIRAGQRCELSNCPPPSGRGRRQPPQHAVDALPGDSRLLELGQQGVQLPPGDQLPVQLPLAGVRGHPGLATKPPRNPQLARTSKFLLPRSGIAYGVMTFVGIERFAHEEPARVRRRAPEKISRMRSRYVKPECSAMRQRSLKPGFMPGSGFTSMM